MINVVDFCQLIYDLIGVVIFVLWKCC